MSLNFISFWRGLIFFYSILHTILILSIHKYVISPQSFKSSLIHLDKICRFFPWRLCIFWGCLFLDILCVQCSIQILFWKCFKKYFLIFWLYIEIQLILTCWTVCNLAGLGWINFLTISLFENSWIFKYIFTSYAKWLLIFKHYIIFSFSSLHWVEDLRYNVV